MIFILITVIWEAGNNQLCSGSHRHPQGQVELVKQVMNVKLCVFLHKDSEDAVDKLYAAVTQNLKRP